MSFISHNKFIELLHKPATGSSTKQISGGSSKKKEPSSLEYIFSSIMINKTTKDSDDYVKQLVGDAKSIEIDYDVEVSLADINKTKSIVGGGKRKHTFEDFMQTYIKEIEAISNLPVAEDSIVKGGGFEDPEIDTIDHYLRTNEFSYLGGNSSYLSGPAAADGDYYGGYYGAATDGDCYGDGYYGAADSSVDSSSDSDSDSTSRVRKVRFAPAPKSTPTPTPTPKRSRTGGLDNDTVDGIDEFKTMTPNEFDKSMQRHGTQRNATAPTHQLQPLVGDISTTSECFYTTNIEGYEVCSKVTKHVPVDVIRKVVKLNNYEVGKNPINEVLYSVHEYVQNNGIDEPFTATPSTSASTNALDAMLRQADTSDQQYRDYLYGVTSAHTPNDLSSSVDQFYYTIPEISFEIVEHSSINACKELEKYLSLYTTYHPKKSGGSATAADTDESNGDADADAEYAISGGGEGRMDTKEFLRRFNDTSNVGFKPSGPSNSTSWLTNINIRDVIAQIDLDNRITDYGLVMRSWKANGLQNKVFIDTFIKKKITSLDRPYGVIVLNTDTWSGRGTHWQCIVIDRDNKRIEFFDSCGKKPHADFMDMMETINKHLFGGAATYDMSAKCLQTSDSECGMFCLAYIISRIIQRSVSSVGEFCNLGLDKFGNGDANIIALRKRIFTSNFTY